MMKPLTKSYANTYDPNNPVQEDLTLYQLFDKARKEGVVGEFINLETKTRSSTAEVFLKADEYAKGLLAIGCTPGEDTIAVIGCPTLEAVYLFTAACSIGVSYGQPYIYTPKDTTINRILPLLRCKVLVVGEGSAGTVLSTLMNMVEDCDTPKSERLSFVEHVFYDNTYKDRSPQQKCIKPLDRLRQLGESITDQQLEEARKLVKPEFVAHHVFTSGSTGGSKCVDHTNRGLANDLLTLRFNDVGPAIAMNPCMDEMGAFACIAWTLAGKMSKTIFNMDFSEELDVDKMAKACVQIIVQERVEALAMTGPIHQAIADYLESNNIQIQALKYILNGGQLVSRQLKVNQKSVFGGKQFTLYGMSETFGIANTTFGDEPEDEEARLGAKLYPKPNTELMLVDEKNHIVDIGKTGEIQVKTFSILKGYRSEEEKTRKAFTDDGFLRTGDLAVMHPDGTFTIKGRVADSLRFKVRGVVIYPGPIETVLSEYPGFEGVLVISAGVNDLIGDEITYCIRLKRGATKPAEDEILTFIYNNGLDDLQVPTRIIYFDKLPTTPNCRKVSKAQLREQVQSMIKDDPQAGLTECYRKATLQSENL